MGLSHDKHAKLLASLNPLPTTEAEKKPKNEVVTEDRTIGNEEFYRGVPMLVQGRGLPLGGAIKGTRPGDDSDELATANEDVARALKAAGSDIVRAHLHRNRYRPEETK